MKSRSSGSQIPELFLHALNAVSASAL